MTAWHWLVAYRVSAALLAAALALGIVETIALLALNGRAHWIAASWNYATHPLTGEDGRLSFTKLFDLVLVAAYTIRGPTVIPASVAITLIASAHGTKVLLAALEAKVATATSTQTTQVTETQPAAPATKTTTTTTPVAPDATNDTPDKPLPKVSSEG